MSSSRSAQIDFKKYRTPELFATVSELIDVRGTLGKGFVQAALATLLFSFLMSTILCGITYLREFDHWLMIVIIMFPMGVPIAFPVGVVFAIAHLIRRSIGNMLQIVDQLLATTKNVALDIRAVQSGDTAMPSPKKLVSGVYLEVFLPIIEQVISDQLWILARPALFLYRLTFGRLMRIVIAMLPEKTLEKAAGMPEGESVETTAKAIVGNLEKIADNETTLIGALDWTRGKIGTIGRKAKLFVMLPCYAVGVGVVLLDVVATVSLWLTLIWAFSLGG